MPMERMLFPDKYKSVCLYIEPDYPYIHRELAKHGVTLTLLWEEYRRKCYDEGKKPYMFTQFGEKYRKWARVTKATMRIQHKPGDAIEVDWAGDTIPISLGLGTFFSGFSIVAAKDNKHILDFLGVNSSDELLSCLVIGYPDVKYKRTVPRKDAVINWM